MCERVRFNNNNRVVWNRCVYILRNFRGAAIMYKLCLEILIIVLQWCKAEVRLLFPISILNDRATPLSFFNSPKIAPLSAIARAGTLFGKPLEAIAIHPKTSLNCFPWPSHNLQLFHVYHLQNPNPLFKLYRASMS